MITDNTCMVQVQEIKGLRADGVLYTFGLNCSSTYQKKQKKKHKQDSGSFTGDFLDRKLVLYCFLSII